jgi:hypothetical protein
MFGCHVVKGFQEALAPSSGRRAIAAAVQGKMWEGNVGGDSKKKLEPKKIETGMLLKLVQITR